MAFLAFRRICRRSLAINFLGKAEYRSVYNVENLYPNSSSTQSHTTVETKGSKNSSQKTFTGIIPTDELQISYEHNQAPGAMVGSKALADRIKSAVEIRFHVRSAKWIPEPIKLQLIEKEAGRITKDGFLVVSSSKTRMQILNQADCLEKLRSMIWAAGSERTADPEIMRLRLEQEKTKFLRLKKSDALKQTNNNV